jgi:hypothetical protein
MTHLISVEPFGDGWTVRSDQLDNDMVFQRGAAAEAAAKILGDGLARRGRPAKIVIRLRDGTIAGQFVCAPLTNLEADMRTRRRPDPARPRQPSRPPWNLHKGGLEPARPAPPTADLAADPLPA